MTYQFSNVVVISILNSKLTGNQASSPRRYWPWVNRFPEYDIATVRSKDVAGRIVIIGGGLQLHQRYFTQLEMIASHAKEWYLWGVGIQNPGVLDWEIVQQAQLVGLRDSIHMEQRGVLDSIWDTACPSIMHPLFANPPEPRFDVVAFMQSESSAPQLKTITTTATVNDALYHISLGKRVVTDSYYGGLWASWMGRQVMTLDDFDNERELAPNEAGRERYNQLVRKQREFERFIGSKITLEPV